MERGGWRPSPLTVGVTLVVAAATVLGFVLTNRSVASQNQALLKSDTTQAAEYVSSSSPPSVRRSKRWPPSVTLTNATPAAVRPAGQGVAAEAGTVFLARKTSTGFVVAAAVGTRIRRRTVARRRPS